MWLRSIALAPLIASNSSAWERRVVVDEKDRVPKERLPEPSCKPTRTKLTPVGLAGKWATFELKYFDDKGEAYATSVLARMQAASK
jgi:hypothetical protein